MNANSSPQKPKTIGQWLKEATRALEGANIGTARLDALVLLQDALEKDKSWILAHSETRLRDLDVATLDTQLTQRLQHFPLAYVRGKTEFYGRDFLLNHDVLEPRPESETMIELIKTISDPRPWNITDVGTGSGAIAITAKLEFPESTVSATDIDPNCLELARKNAKKHTVDIRFYHGNLLEPFLASEFRIPTSVLLANLPYVPDHYQLNDAAMMEPRVAIFGGSDGLDLYRQLFTQLDTHKANYVLTESLPFQHDELRAIATEHGYTEQAEDDFIQLFKRS